MLDMQLDSVLDGKSEQARSLIADRVGQHLASADLDNAERRAAEALARELASDVIEQVRRQLSKAVMHARFLPKDIALKIAHDVESVACPFLVVTEVFSDGDWQQICRTLSQSALAAVARRSSMSEGLAQTLAEFGDSQVAETLADNPASPMTETVCDTLTDRFGSDIRVLDRLAQRDDLVVEIAIRLIAIVSDAARQKLLTTYSLPDFTEPIGVEAEDAALLQLIRQAPDSRFPALVQGLKRKGKLSFSLLLAALRANRLAFLQAALSDLAETQSDIVGTVLQRADSHTVCRLLRKARIPEAMDHDFWQALTDLRGDGGRGERRTGTLQ